MEGLISIIVPMYNVENFIERCIQSVINQTRSNWELILINDGSNDGTEDICNKFISDKRIHLYNNEVNNGVSYSRNIGIEKSNGKWITFLDADDEFKNDYIENATKIIDRDDCDIIIGEVDSSLGQKYFVKKDVMYTPQNKINLIRNIITNENNNENYDSKMLGYAGGKLYKKTVINNIKFSVNIKFKEDMIFNLQAFINSENILITKDLSYHYIVNTRSGSFKYINSYINEIEKFKDILEKINNDNSLNLKSEIYICMITMYMKWLKADIMHKDSSLTKKEKIKKIDESFNNTIWQDIFHNVEFKQLTKQYKLLYILYKLKLERLIYLMAKINMHKNQKIFNI